MAHAIPRASWSEPEARCEREFYRDYLINQWLAPGSAVLPNAEDVASAGRIAPTAQALQENRWFLEPEHPCEQ